MVGGWILALCNGNIPTNEVVLFEIAEAVQAGFGRGEVRAEFPQPGAKTLFQPQRHHGPHAKGFQAQIGPGTL